jgi:hypothetical protein
VRVHQALRALLSDRAFQDDNAAMPLYALQACGVQLTQDEVARLQTRLSPVGRVYAAWALQKRTAEQGVLRLKALGVIPPDTRVDVWRNGVDEYLDATDHPMFVMYSGLEAMKAILGFDAETGLIPVRHDELLNSMADISRGAFNPIQLLETYDKKLDAYEVSFVHGTRRFGFNSQDLGDWYDVGAVLHVANRALTASGSSLQYIQLYTGGQDVVLVCAAPQAVAQAASEGWIVLEREDAVARGKAFEEAVLQQVK